MVSTEEQSTSAGSLPPWQAAVVLGLGASHVKAVACPLQSGPNESPVRSYDPSPSSRPVRAVVAQPFTPPAAGKGAAVKAKLRLSGPRGLSGADHDVWRGLEAALEDATAARGTTAAFVTSVEVRLGYSGRLPPPPPSISPSNSLLRKQMSVVLRYTLRFSIYLTYALSRGASIGLVPDHLNVFASPCMPLLFPPHLGTSEPLMCPRDAGGCLDDA